MSSPFLDLQRELVCLVCTNLRPYEICQLIATNSAFSFLKEILLTKEHFTVDTLSNGCKAIYYTRYIKQAYNASHFCSTVPLACDLRDLKHLRVKQATIFIRRLRVMPRNTERIRSFLDRNEGAYISIHGVDAKNRGETAIKKVQVFSIPSSKGSHRIIAIPRRSIPGRLGTLARITQSHLMEVLGTSINGNSYSWLIELDIPRIGIVPSCILAYALAMIVGRYIKFSSNSARTIARVAMEMIPLLQGTFCKYQSLLCHDIAFAQRLSNYIGNKYHKMIRSLPSSSPAERVPVRSVYRCMLARMFGIVDHPEGIVCPSILLDSLSERVEFCVAMGVITCNQSLSPREMNRAVEIYDEVVSIPDCLTSNTS